MSTVARIAIIASRTPPKYRVGQRVKCWQGAGIIDATFVDLEAAIDAMAVPRDWYEIQNVRPKTPKTKAWHSVVLPEGAVLVGDDDIAGSGS